MKKILYYAAQVMLLLASLLMGFVSGTQMIILCLSCLISGFLLMLVWSVSARKGWALFFLYGSAIFFHGYYLSVSASWSLWVFLAALVFLIASLLFLWTDTKTGLEPRLILESALFVKLAYLPEILLNFMMTHDGAGSVFTTFSWVLLAYTSIFSLTAIWMLYKRQILSSAWTTALGLLQFLFGTDLAGIAIALFLSYRHKEDPEPVHRPIYQKASFSKAKKGKAIR